MVKEQNKKSKMTLDKLALLTQRGFLEIGEKFATKEDLKKFATKEDIKKFVTKTELYLALDRTKEEIKQDIKEETRGATDKFLKEADKIAKKLDTLLQEEKMGTALYRRHDKKLEEYGERIITLESKAGV